MKPTPITTLGELQAHDGERVIVSGCYQAVALPRQGGSDPEAARERAVVVLDDATQIYLEPLEDPASVRPLDERLRFDTRRVHVHGRIRRWMPSRGEGLLAPCLTEITEIELEA